ncbi:MAG: trypsin-like serine protease [Ruminococcaceae bacterium]|nr:trypsin-like serine protease [Oscillospiraceae bacterium]
MEDNKKDFEYENKDGASEGAEPKAERNDEPPQNNGYSGYSSYNGGYQQNRSGYDPYGGNNGYGYNGGNGYFNSPPSSSPYGGGPRKSKSGIGSVLIILVVMVALAVSVIYVFSSLYGYVGSPDDGSEIVDGGGNQPGGDEGAEPSGDSQQGSSTAQGDLNDKDFKLEPVPAEEHYKLASVFSLTKDTVVEITTEFITTGSFMQQYVTTGAGSGVIISADGYIVTNHHVIEDAMKVTVKLADGTEYEAKLVGSDVKSDIAVIKIEPKGEISVAKIGISGDLMVCEEILVIGNPLGSLGGSASNGIVSATARQISIEGNMMTLIQTNAAVNPGNSGGAMFNLAGQLVGIVNAKYTDEAVEGIGFAIPIDTAKPIIEDLIAYGYVTGRPNVGVTVKYGTYIQSVGNSNWITEVRAGSDAEKAGLKVYDEIVSIDGISFTSAELVNAYLDTVKIGDTVKFVVRRYTKSSASFWGTTYTTEELTISLTVTEYKK